MSPKISIDTGPNPPVGGNTLLSIHAEDLVRHRGCRIRKFILDESNRQCSYELVDPDGLHFFLVARSTLPWRNVVVSSQRRLVKRVANEEKPLVMWWPASYHVFDPKRILLSNFGMNIRADAGPRIGIEFINWDSSTQIEWKPEESLRRLWELCQKRTHELLTAYV